MITLDGANKQLVGSALFMEQKVVCARYQSIKTSRDDKTVHLSRLLELGTAGLLQAAAGAVLTPESADKWWRTRPRSQHSSSLQHLIMTLSQDPGSGQLMLQACVSEQWCWVNGKYDLSNGDHFHSWSSSLYYDTDCSARVECSQFNSIVSLLFQDNLITFWRKWIGNVCKCKRIATETWEDTAMMGAHDNTWP